MRRRPPQKRVYIHAVNSIAKHTRWGRAVGNEGCELERGTPQDLRTQYTDGKSLNLSRTFTHIRLMCNKTINVN